MHASLPLAALLMLCAAGCLEEPPSAAGPTQFAAVYKTQDGKTFVSLGPPKAILDADGELVQAYPMEIRWEGPGPPDHVVYWLSADLLVVRVDDVCRVQPCPHHYNELSWVLRGAWPPLAYRMPEFHHAGLPQVVWGVQYDFGIQESRERGLTRVDLHPKANLTSNSKPFGNSGIEPRTYFFDGRPLPVAFGNFSHLIEWRPGPPLSGADPLRTLHFAPAKPRASGQWFEGSGTRLLGANASVDQAVANASRDPVFLQALDGCVSSLSTARPYLSSIVGPPALGLVRTTDTPFYATTYPAPGHQATNWEWEYTEPNVGEATWDPARAQPASVGLARCVRGGSQEPVVRGLPEHVERATALLLPAGSAKQPQLAAAFLSYSHHLFGDEHPGLDVGYATGFAEPGAGFGFLTVALEAAQLGVWLSMGGTVDELDGLPGAYGTSPD